MTALVPVRVSRDQTRVFDLSTLAGLEACRFRFVITEGWTERYDGGVAGDRTRRVTAQSGQG